MGLTAMRRWRHRTGEGEEVLSTPLPDDFPGRALLVGAGYTTVEAVRAASDEELLAIRGVGKRLLEQIRHALR